MVKKITEPPKPYVYRYEPYPRWVLGTDGTRKIVQNHEHEERETGVKMNVDGTVFVEPGPHPPTLETVMAAGYAKEVAEKIVDEEAAKARRGEKPYGDKEPEPLQSGAAYEHEKAVAEAAALEPLVKPRGKKSAAPVQSESAEPAKDGAWE